MSKYRESESSSTGKITGIHPIWRGIGFIFMTITPILAYYTTVVVLSLNSTKHWFTIPRSLLAHGSDPYLWIKIGGTFVVVFIVYIIFMLVTFLTYRLFGPSRLGPLDAPQTGFSGKAHRR